MFTKENIILVICVIGLFYFTIRLSNTVGEIANKVHQNNKKEVILK